MTETAAMGPIDFVLIEFPPDAEASATASALTDLVESGTIRLFDIALLHKTAEGAGIRELSAVQALAAFVGAQSGLFSDEDVEQALDAMDPNTAGLLIAFENAWAAPFVAAASGDGGHMIASDRIPAQVMLDVLDAVEAQT
jgi:hypothetical protein